MTIRFLAFAFAAFVYAFTCVACTESQRKNIEPPAPQLPENQPLAFVVLSDTAPAKGSSVTVTAYVRNSKEDGAIGSFTAQMAFDTTGLVFLEQSPISDGMRAVNTKPGVIRAAGASTAGFPDGKLFTVHFRVDRTDAVRSLALKITQLNGTDFSPKLPTLVVSPRLYLTPPR